MSGIELEAPLQQIKDANTVSFSLDNSLLYNKIYPIHILDGPNEVIFVKTLLKIDYNPEKQKIIIIINSNKLYSRHHKVFEKNEVLCSI